MDPVYVALIAAATTLLGSLSTYLVARTQHTKALTKAVEQAAAPAVEAERARIAERRDDLAKALAAELNVWSENTPTKVTRERCDSRCGGLEKRLSQLDAKVDGIVGSVGDLGREVSGLAGEVRRINGGSGA